MEEVRQLTAKLFDKNIPFKLEFRFNNVYFNIQGKVLAELGLVAEEMTHKGWKTEHGNWTSIGFYRPALDK